MASAGMLWKLKLLLLLIIACIVLLILSLVFCCVDEGCVENIHTVKSGDIVDVENRQVKAKQVMFHRK